MKQADGVSYEVQYRNRQVDPDLWQLLGTFKRREEAAVRIAELSPRYGQVTKFRVLAVTRTVLEETL